MATKKVTRSKSHVKPPRAVVATPDRARVLADAPTTELQAESCADRIRAAGKFRRADVPKGETPAEYTLRLLESASVALDIASQKVGTLRSALAVLKQAAAQQDGGAS